MGHLGAGGVAAEGSSVEVSRRAVRLLPRQWSMQQASTYDWPPGHLWSLVATCGRQAMEANSQMGAVVVKVQLQWRQQGGDYAGAGMGVTKGSSVEVSRRANRLPSTGPERTRQVQPQ